MNPKPLAPLTHWLVLLLTLYLGILLVAIGADSYSYSEYSKLNPITDVAEQLLASDVVNLIVVLIQLVGFILVGITFLRWIYRANQNLRAQSDRSMIFTPGWAIGWYFIPVASLFKPYQAMKEIWAVAHCEPIYGHRIPGNALLRVWWIVWLLSNLFGQISFRAALKAQDVESHVFSAEADFASDVVRVPLTLAALLLVHRIGKAYETNYAASSPGTPPPLPIAS